MSLLLDTHALLWWLEGGERLTAAAMESIADPHKTVAVSAASIWEASIKAAAGKLVVDGSLVAAASEAGFYLLPITGTHAEKAGALPAHHRDPFDRMLIAQAVSEDLVVVTRDRSFALYDVGVLAC